MKINYICQGDTNTESFYVLPKGLCDDEPYKNLTSDAKLLYVRLLDRVSLSRANNWLDEYGRYFIYFTRDDARARLGVSEPTIAKLFRELSSMGLISEVRQGLGKPNIIYVGRIDPKGTRDDRRARTKTRRGNVPSRDEGTDLQTFKPINTDISKTEFSKTETSKDIPLTELTYLTVSNLLSPSGNHEKIDQKKAKSAKAWEAYATAYQARYGVEPVRNAKVNKQLCNLVDRLGEEAEEVIKHYLRSNERYYVSKGHSVDPLLGDAEKLRTQWKTKDAKPSKEKELEEYLGPHGYATWQAGQRLIQKIRSQNNG